MTSALTTRVNARAYERRWLILAVLCFSLLVIVLDNTILNVAIPTIVRDLDATNSQLQWMVDSYTLVFAGLLLTAGALGDRFGRRGALQFGLVVFGIGSLASAFANSADQLIATRAFMGIGGAFIMPATLSIITNVFPPAERGKAIGVWAGTAGLAGVLGPTIGGFLLEHFYWGSVFLVNIPIVVVGILAGVFLIPTSKDPTAPRLDPIGALLSITGLVALLYAIIEAPQNGWTNSTILAAFAIGAVLLVAFIAWEAHTDHPMLDVRFFKNPRFTAASLSIMFVFFSMFGVTFLLTQYLQFVLGYTPFQAGIRFLPWAVVMLIGAPLERAARAPHRHEDHRRDRHGLRDRRAVLARRAVHRQSVLPRRRVAAHAHGGRDGARDGAGDRVDHGLAAARQGRGGLRGERHHPPGRRCAGCRGHRQRARLDLRPPDERLPRRQAGEHGHLDGDPGVARRRDRLRAPDRGAGPALRSHSPRPRKRSSTRSTPARSSARASPLVGAIMAAIWLPAHARQSDVDAQQAAHDHVPAGVEQQWRRRRTSAPEPAEL